MPSDCIIADCNKASSRRGWCSTHYDRWRRHGDPAHPTQRYVQGTSLERLIARAEQDSVTGCWEWDGGRTSDGYGLFKMGPDAGGLAELSHRASWILHRGPIPDDLCVLHTCDNPPCVNPDHLFLGTNADNVADRESKGRGIRGERVGASKLTRDQVREIRARFDRGDRRLRIAHDFGITKTHVHMLGHRKSWSWLDKVES